MKLFTANLSQYQVPMEVFEAVGLVRENATGICHLLKYEHHILLRYNSLPCGTECYLGRPQASGNVQEKYTFSVNRIPRLYVIPVVFFHNLPSFFVGHVTRKHLLSLIYILLFSQQSDIFTSPSTKNSKKYFSFCHNSQVFQFTYLPFSLATAPQVFPVIVKEVKLMPLTRYLIKYYIKHVPTNIYFCFTIKTGILILKNNILITTSDLYFSNTVSYHCMKLFEHMRAT